MRWPWQKKPRTGGGAPPKNKQGAGPVAADACATQNAAPDERQARLALLTPRERDVFEQLVRGKKLKEAAEALGIRYSTVNTHQKNVYKKLGVNSRAECILTYGLLNTEPKNPRGPV